MLQFWTNVKDELEYNAMTQKQLADLVEISYNTIQSWITKDRLPNAEQAVRIAKALSTSVEFLVTGEDSNNTNSETRHTILKIKQNVNKIVDEYLK
jgi:transcriptional regulator with XRE-family HTH domain